MPRYRPPHFYLYSITIYDLMVEEISPGQVIAIET